MIGVSSAVLRELEQACPSGAAEALDTDLVDGVRAGCVAYPTSTSEAAAALAVAAAHGLSVVARGAATKLDWGNPPERLDLVLDLSHMSRVLEHASGDLVARVQAGVTLADLAPVLASSGQRLPIDEVVQGSTVGGVVATGLSGPLRYGHGAVRDLLLGVTVVRADGVVARAGSKVVKNVAGYDLPKLFTGSYGTLGLLTELTFKLRPLPEAQLFVSSSFSNLTEAGAALAELVRSQASPVAIELSRLGPAADVEICALVEGGGTSTEVRAAQLSRLMARAHTGTKPPAWWGTLPSPVLLKLTGVLSAVPVLVERASQACASRGMSSAALSGSAGAGVLYLGLPEATAPEDLSGLLQPLRRAAAQAQGYVTVLRAPAAAKYGVDVWGPVPGLELMRRVKERFDPGHRLSPGRFVGGI